MATRRYKISPSQPVESIVEEVGAAVNSNLVELTVELAVNAVNDGSTQRVISKMEVLEALDKFKQHIVEGNWPPAV